MSKRSLPPNRRQLRRTRSARASLRPRVSRARAATFARRWAAAAPDDPGAHVTVGIVANNLLEFQEAHAALTRALELSPEAERLWFYRGAANADLGLRDEAIADYDRALQLNPRFPEAMAYKAELLARRNGEEEAAALLRSALNLAPNYALAWLGLAQILKSSAQHAAALQAVERAIQLGADPAKSWLLEAETLFALDRPSQALASLEKAVEAGAPQSETDPKMLRYRRCVFDWRGDKARVDRILFRALNSDFILAPNTATLLPVTAAQQLQITKKYLKPLPPREPLAPSPAASQRTRIRLAYYARDLIAPHAISTLMAAMLEAHDRERFELIAFDYHPPESSQRGTRIRKSFEVVHEVRKLSDEERARAIHRADVDILVDVDGMTALGRPAPLSWRPAPVQVNFLGHPGTGGADFYDYIVADRIVIPPEARPFYPEAVVYMPHTYLPTDDTRPVASATERRADHGLPDQAFVFASFNVATKVSPEHFAAWLRILKATPNSALWIFALFEPQQSLARLRAAAQAQGVDPERVIIAAHLPSYERHLSRMALADLFLDTWPYSAHTTGADALWAGLPVLSLMKGDAFPARVSSSLLTAVGLPQLINTDLAEYERRAVELATVKQDELRAYRKRLVDNRRSLPLFDTLAYTRALESAFEEMHTRRLAGQRPTDIDLSRLAG